MNRSSRAIVAAIAISFAIGACTGPSAPSEQAPRDRDRPADRPVARPAEGGTLHVLLAGDVDSLDPHRAARPSSWFFARALHRGLLTFPAQPAPAGARPVADLAAVPDVSANGRRYTFRLAGDAAFGPPVSRPVTAADAKASIERVIRLGRGIAQHLHVIRGASAYARGRTPDVSGIVASDDGALTIRLTRPATDLPWLLAHPQVAVVPETVPRDRAVPPRAIAPAGPYLLASYSPERSIVLERNPAWNRDADPVRGAHVARIEATIGDVRDAAARVADGRFDLVVDPGPPDPDEPPGAPPAGARVARVSPGCVRYAFLNRSVRPFNDARVRRAVAHAIERDGLVLAGGSVPAPRILPPTVVGHAASPVLPEDVPRARALLREAGHPRGFATTLIVGDSPRDRREAAALRRSLARAGIRVSIRRVPPATLYSGYYEDPARRVPMGIATWCADWPGLAGRGVLGVIADPREARDRAPNHVYSDMRSEAVERAIDRAVSAPTEEAARRWAEADAQVVRTGAIVPLTWPNEEVVRSDRVRGWVGAPMWPRGDPTALWLDRPGADRRGG